MNTLTTFCLSRAGVAVARLLCDAGQLTGPNVHRLPLWGKLLLLGKNPAVYPVKDLNALPAGRDGRFCTAESRARMSCTRVSLGPKTAIPHPPGLPGPKWTMIYFSPLPALALSMSPVAFLTVHAVLFGFVVPPSCCVVKNGHFVTVPAVTFPPGLHTQTHTHTHTRKEMKYSGVCAF